MTSSFWTTDEGKSLHLELARLAGCADRFVLMKRDLYYRPEGCGYTGHISEAWVISEAEANKHVYPHDEPVTKHPAPLPPAHDLIRQLESGLSEEQRNSYSVTVARDLKAFTSHPQSLFRLITCPDETRSRAMVEVLK